MPQNFIQGGGDKTKMTIASLPAGNRVEPTNQTVTLGAASSGATLITCAALTSPIGRFNAIEVSSNPLRYIYLASDAPAGATSLIVEPLEAAISAGTEGEYKAKLRLLGGTSTGNSIGANRISSVVFEDVAGYEDGVIGSQNWSMPWTANLLPSDPAYRIVFNASIYAVQGRELYVWQETPPPSGFVTGDIFKGIAVVTDFSREIPADGIVTFTCTFSGQGSPSLVKYA